MTIYFKNTTAFEWVDTSAYNWISNGVIINAAPLEFTFNISGSFFSDVIKIITDWKKNKNLGPWRFEKSEADNRYNEGNLISSASDPVWNLDSKRGTPITNAHNPCGYWTKEYVSVTEETYYNPFAIGWNVNYQTGYHIGATVPPHVVVPTANPDISLARMFSCGNKHTHLIDQGGNLYATGIGTNGSLGLGPGSSEYQYTLVSSDQWKFIASGLDYSFGVRDNGDLYATGFNNNGILGLGDSTTRYYFTKVGSAKWLIMACSRDTSFGIQDDGTLWAAGQNIWGQYGDGVTGIGGYKVFTLIPGYLPSDVSVGEAHSCILVGDSVYTAGGNYTGQLGDGTTTKRTSFTLVHTGKKISCGKEHTCIIGTDDYLYSTGKNDYGQLGVGDNTLRTSFTKVGSDKWLDIACGYTHTIALRNDGTLWGTGQNNNYQLGLNDTTHRNTMTQIGSANDWTYVAKGSYRHHSLIATEQTIFITE